MERTLKIDIYDNYILYDKNNKFMQSDGGDTCFLELHFLGSYGNIDWADKSVLVNYKRPDGIVVQHPVANPSSVLKIEIPQNAINQTGVTSVEIVIMKGSTSILTINRAVLINVYETNLGATGVTFVMSESITTELQKLITDLNTATSNASTGKQELDTSINNAETKKTELEETINTADSKKILFDSSIADLDNSILESKTMKTNLDSSISTANAVNNDLGAIISESNTAKTNLDSSISTANAGKGNLDKSITNANTAKADLDISIQNSETSKTNLDDSISIANTKKQDLDTANSLAEQNKNDLDNSISNANTAKNELDLSIENGTTSKTNLDSSIATGDTVNSTLNTTISTATTAQSNLQDKIDEVPSLIQSITDEGTTQVNNVIAEGDTQVTRLADGGYVEITDIDTDFNLQVGYYEVFDAKGNQFSVRVDSTLEIPENSVIKDVAGYVRLQGVELPCKVAIRDYPTLTDNTNGEIFLEVESDFDNRGSTEAIKSLIK